MYHYNYNAQSNAANAKHDKRVTAGAAQSEIYPFVVDIGRVTVHNENFRTVLRTGNHMQMTVMNILPEDDIGLEVHPLTDQFICIQKGYGYIQMGESENHLPLKQPVFENTAMIIPAGTWHNIVNTGPEPLKLFTLYAPPEHARGAVHFTKADAEEAEHYTAQSSYDL